MGSNPATFRQRDVTQAIVGAQRAGLSVSRVEIDKQGKIVIYAGAPPPDAGCGNTEANECDAVFKELGIPVSEK